MLRWTFDGSCEWFAESAIGVSLFWRIGVCDDGTFAVNESRTYGPPRNVRFVCGSQGVL